MMRRRLRGADLRLTLYISMAALGIGVEFLFAADRNAVFFALALAVGAVTTLAMTDPGRRPFRALEADSIKLGVEDPWPAPAIAAQRLRMLAPDQRTPMGAIAERPTLLFSQCIQRSAHTLGAGAGYAARLHAFSGVLGGEGATTAVLCFAQALALQGRRVLVVDCDLRKRGLTRDLEIDPEIGLRDVLCEGADWNAAIVRNLAGGFDLLPLRADRSPFHDLISLAGWHELLGTLRWHYDVVLLDCPPLLASAEGRHLAVLADETHVVLKSGVTPLAAAIAASRLLSQRQARVGLFVNHTPESVCKAWSRTRSAEARPRATRVGIAFGQT